MDKIRKMNWRFSKFEYKLMEEYLEEMSHKGWRVVEVNKRKASFVKSKPQKLKFLVDVTPNAETLFHKGDETMLEEYRNSYKEKGWKFISSYDQMQFFYSEEIDGDVNKINKLETDKTLIINNVWKSELYKQLFLLIYLLLLTSVVLLGKNNLNYRILSDSVMFFTVFLLYPLAYILVVGSIIKSIIWYIKAKQNIKNGMEIEKKSLKWVKLRNILLDIVNYIIIVFIVLVYINTSFPRGVLYNWTTKLLFLSIAVFVIYSLRFYIKFGDYINEKRKYIYMLLFFLFITLIIYSISKISLDIIDNNPKDLQVVPDKYVVLKISDFEDIYEIDSNDFMRTYSPLVPIHYKYYEYYNEDTYIGYSIETEYFECINENIADKIYDDILSDYEGRKYLSITIETAPEENWGCDKLAFISDNWILLLKDNKVLEINAAKDLISIDSDEFREKLFNKFNIGKDKK